jgi:hypothetical protein
VDVSVFDFQVESQLIQIPMVATDEARSVIGDTVTDLWRNALALGAHLHRTLDVCAGGDGLADAGGGGASGAAWGVPGFCECDDCDVSESWHPGAVCEWVFLQWEDG